MERGLPHTAILARSSLYAQRLPLFSPGSFKHTTTYASTHANCTMLLSQGEANRSDAGHQFLNDRHLGRPPHPQEVSTPHGRLQHPMRGLSVRHCAIISTSNHPLPLSITTLRISNQHPIPRLSPANMTSLST